MTLPNFLIIGAAKSGTTSLYRYLQQHPQIYMNVKEPSFFALEGQDVHYAGPGDQDGFVRKIVTTLDDYEALFQGVKDERAYGEASVLYLYCPEAVGRIRHYIPDVKIIAILRNPIDRAFSSYNHLRRDGREPLSDFIQALQVEDERVAANWQHQWHYTRLGFYYTQLKRYFDLFPTEQIAVYTYDEFQNRPADALRDIFRFLGVDTDFVPDVSTKYNISGVPKSRTLQTFLTKPGFIKNVFKPFIPLSVRRQMGTKIRTWNVETTRPQLSIEARDYLLQLYRDDILQLESLIQRDLSAWLKSASS